MPIVNPVDCGLIFFEYKMNLAYHRCKIAIFTKRRSNNACWLAVPYRERLTTRCIGYPRPVINACLSCLCGKYSPDPLMCQPGPMCGGRWDYIVNLFIGSTIQSGKNSGHECGDGFKRPTIPGAVHISMTVIRSHRKNLRSMSGFQPYNE